ncbi:MAG TPA: HAMP domain-containing sensor histidine kinase [Ohtaekwangia sp.]|nr:HAMP domain-containing sensor histidine kinase [Ohtaekwangia sp.]
MTTINLSDHELIHELKKRLAAKAIPNVESPDMLIQMMDLNERLEQSEAMKSHFISNIKNEINNPLASILALTQNLLRKAGSLPAEAVHGLNMISNEAHALNFQMDNIITAAEIEAGYATPQYVEANITLLIQHVLHAFNNIIVRKKLSIKFNSGESIHFVTDPRYFKIILANLVSNAIKFSRENGEVTIDTQLCSSLVISVTDSGAGIKSKDAGKIFDRFIQLDTGVIKKFQGHGLGLSVIKDLTELLGGKVSVTSPGEGCTFIVTLPEQPSAEGFSIALSDGDEILFDQIF